MGWKEALLQFPCEIGAQIFSIVKSTTSAANVDKTKHRFSEQDICRLQKLFPSLNLRAVRYVDDARRPTNGYMFSGGMSMTLGYTIYFLGKRKNMSDTHVIHELYHVEQYRKLGNSDYRFGCEYGKGYARAGFSYDNNQMEKDAKKFSTTHSLPPLCDFNGEIYRVDPDARNYWRQIFGGKMSKKWDIIVSGNFDENSGYSEFGFYNKHAGVFSIFPYLRDARRPFNHPLHEQRNIGKKWDIIVPGNFWGNTNSTDLAFYDRENGYVAIYEVDLSSNKPVKLRSADNRLRTTYHTIVSGEFWGKSGHDDLMCYDKEAGEIDLYRINPNANINTRILYKKTIKTRKTWDIIIPGEFVGASGHTDLLCYDRNAGEGVFYRINPKASQYMKAHTTRKGWRKTWDKIVSGEFGGTGGRKDLLFYDKKNGDGEIYRVDPKARNFMKNKFASRKWRKTWNNIVIGQFGGTGSEEDVFFYEKSTITPPPEPAKKGSVGSRVDTRDWSNGWTQAVPFTVGSSRYLFLLKEGNGIVHIHRLNSNGTVGSQVVKYDWSKGWSTVSFYTVGGKTYLFLLKKSNGAVHIHRMNT